MYPSQIDPHIGLVIYEPGDLDDSLRAWIRAELAAGRPLIVRKNLHAETAGYVDPGFIGEIGRRYGR